MDNLIFMVSPLSLFSSVSGCGGKNFYRCWYLVGLRTSILRGYCLNCMYASLVYLKSRDKFICWKFCFSISYRHLFLQASVCKWINPSYFWFSLFMIAIKYFCWTLFLIIGDDGMFSNFVRSMTIWSVISEF